MIDLKKRAKEIAPIAIGAAVVGAAAPLLVFGSVGTGMVYTGLKIGGLLAASAVSHGVTSIASSVIQKNPSDEKRMVFDEDHYNEQMLACLSRSIPSHKNQ